MKAVSFLSFAFMAASALAAPFQAEASSFEVSTRDMTAGNSVTTRSELVPNEKRIIDAASLISTLKDFQSSLGEPLSALDGLTKNAKGGSISKSEAIQKAQAQFAEVAEILGNLVSELTDLPGLEASRDDIKDIISLVKAFSEQLFGSSLSLISNVGFNPLFTSDFATILGHIVSVGQLLNDHLKDLAPRFLDQLRPLLSVLRPLFGYLRALLGGLGNGPIITLFAQFLDKLIAF